MSSKNLVEFHVVGRKIFKDYPKALAQAKLWGAEVVTFPMFSQDRKDWEQANGFELVSWGNPATCRNKTKTYKPRKTHWTSDADRTPDWEYLEFAVNDMRMR